MGSWCKGLGAALLVALFVPAVATAVPCDPIGSDATEIADVRAEVEATCPCDGFDRHGKYVKCAKGVIDNAAESLAPPMLTNPRCKRHLKQIYARSTCSFPTERANGSPIDPRVCCVIKRGDRVKAVPLKAARCGTTPGGLVQKVACPGFEICLDAADEDGNGVVDGSDSGACSGPVCGDGFVQAGTGVCSAGTCSAGRVGASCAVDSDCDEQCDDGIVFNSDEDPDACRTNCSTASCGDGTVDAGETCDDGGNVDCDNNCDSDCTTGCGNGITCPPEECDDGLANSDVTPDACRTTCVNAFCGDGIVDTGEACEVGGDVSACTPDGCSFACTCTSCDGVALEAPGEQCDAPADDTACPGLCSSLCSCPEVFPAPLVPGAAFGGSFSISKGLFGPGVGSAPINLSGTMVFADGGDLGISSLQAIAPLVGGLSPVAFFGNTVCVFFESVNPGSCPNPGTCTDTGTCSDVGTCPNNGTCTNLGACDVGTCPNPGTCSTDTCTDIGLCNNSATCSTGICGFGGTCASGPNTGNACTNDADCGACSAPSPFTGCTADADCNFCQGGAEAGSACPSGLHADCDNACAGGGPFTGNACTADADCPACDVGPNAGNSCTTTADCNDVCVGGQDAGASCGSDTDCDNICVGGLDNGVIGCVAPPNVGPKCDHACEGGQLTAGSCGQEGGTADDTICGDVCEGGSAAGSNCTSPTDTCADACAGGLNVGAACVTDAGCNDKCVGGVNAGAGCGKADDTLCADLCVGGLNPGALCNSGAACISDPTAGGGWVDCTGEGVMIPPDPRGVALAGFSLPVDDDMILYQDHCTGNLGVPGPPDTCDSGLHLPGPGGFPCHPALAGLGGLIDPNTGLCVSDGAPDPGCAGGTLDAFGGLHGFTSLATCNGPTVGPLPTGPSVVGSSAMVVNTAVDIRPGLGNPCAPPTLTPPNFQPLVTGTAVTGIMDAFGVPAGAVPCGASCDVGLLASAVSGSLFSCPDILQGSASGGKLVTNLPVLDTTAVGPPVDLNLSTRYEFQ